MQSISIPAHLDGKFIALDEPYPLVEDAKLMATVIADDDETWRRAFASFLNKCTCGVEAARTEDMP